MEFGAWVLEFFSNYPFGMQMDGFSQKYATTGATNRYDYNGKELNGDLGLDMHDYGARWYDASMGRWNAVNPLAEKAPNWTPYRYGFNNPMRFADPSGLYEIGFVELTEAQQKELDQISDKKDRRQKERAMNNTNRANLRAAINAVEGFLNDNEDTRQVFEDFSGIKADSRTHLPHKGAKF